MSRTRDSWISFWQRYELGVWEPQTRALLEEVLRPGDLFVDVGAWIGPVTLWALRLGAGVVAVEPDPVAAAELRRLTGAEIWEGAIVAEPSGAVFLDKNPRPEGELGDSMSSITFSGQLPVSAWTLQEVLGGRIPKLVKIDVEGYEMELLPVLAPWLAELGAIVQVSFHEGCQPEDEWFAGFDHVNWIPHARRAAAGDLVARP